MRWKTEHRLQIMNSVTLLALLIFTSTSRGSSYFDFSELDGDDFQNEFFDDEVAFTSNSEETTPGLSVATADSFQTELPHLEILPKGQEKTREEETDVGKPSEGSFNNSNSELAPVHSDLNEVAADKHLLGQFLDQATDYLNEKSAFQNEETEPSQTPQRREIKNWKVSEDFFDNNNVPWSVDAYYPRLGQNEYVEDTSYSEDKTQDVPAVVLAGDFKDQNSHLKHPQYFQKNYYYNYYPLINERKVTAPRWGAEEIYSPEESNKRIETAVGRKPLPNPCRQYLEFLKYAFEKLDENSEYYYEPNDEYADDWRENSEKTHRVFGTQLLGPTFYVDNSGKISQVNTNGNSVQVAEGISPESKLSIFSKSFSKPKTVTPATDTQTYVPTTPRDNFFKMDRNHKSSTETVFPDTTYWSRPIGDYERHPTTIPTNFEEQTTSHERDDAVPTYFPEEYYGRMGIALDKRITTEPENSTATFSHPYWFTRESTTPQTFYNTPKENIFRVKTMLSIEDSTELESVADADCKDKMLPCPDTVNITYPLNGYCNRYVSCESGRAIRKTCPEGLHFNLIIKSCDLPHNSFCTYNCPQPNGHFGIPGDCGGYFVCKNSNPEYRMCPPRMHWDISRGICTFAQLSSCPMKCFRENEVRHYEGDCKAYIVCLNGIPYYHKCPPNTKFDSTALICVPEKKSTCRDDPRLLTNTLNPNALCNDVQIQLNSNSWCRSFMPYVKREF